MQKNVLRKNRITNYFKIKKRTIKKKKVVGYFEIEKKTIKKKKVAKHFKKKKTEDENKNMFKIGFFDQKIIKCNWQKKIQVLKLRSGSKKIFFNKKNTKIYK